MAFSSSIKKIMTMTKEFDILFLIVGAIAGVLLRYKITAFPPVFGMIGSNVIIVNIVGSFILGIFSVLSESLNLDSRYSFLVAIGFCGTLTTMSSFALESTELFENKQFLQMSINIFANVLFSLLSIYGGRILITAILK